MKNANLGPWEAVLSKEKQEIADELAYRAKLERADGKTIYPPQDLIFNALLMTPPESVRVVIVGQDPYINPGQAQGLAFSVAPGCTLPPSLRNIFKELHDDVGCPIPESGDLTLWAEQGVLLLNTVLTVEQGKSNSHAGWGWQEFTLAVFEACAKLPQPVVFILWGGQARAFCAGLDLHTDTKEAIWSSHPSPLGATKGNEAVPAFIGSCPFSTANRLLARMGAKPVNWALSTVAVKPLPLGMGI